MNIGKAVEKRISKIGLTSNGLSIASGVSPSVIARLLAGGNMTVKTLEKVACVLDVPLSKLIKEAEECQ